MNSKRSIAGAAGQTGNVVSGIAVAHVDRLLGGCLGIESRGQEVEPSGQLAVPGDEVVGPTWDDPAIGPHRHLDLGEEGVPVGHAFATGLVAVLDGLGVLAIRIIGLECPLTI